MKKNLEYKKVGNVVTRKTTFDPEEIEITNITMEIEGLQNQIQNYTDRINEYNTIKTNLEAKLATLQSFQ